MARAHFVKSARKDHKEIGVKKGESYWWWKFRFGGIHKSKTQPKASQLTQSEFLGTMYDLQERISDLRNEATPEDLQSMVEEIVSDIQQLGEDCQEKLDNMPEQLQYAPTGEMLQERIDGCEQWASDLESVDFDTDIDEDEIRQEIRDEMEQELEDDEDEIDETELATRVQDRVEELNQEKVEEIVSELENADPCMS